MHRSAAGVAIDIGSTVIKVAMVGDDGELLSQQFSPRDFEAGIVKQVESLLVSLGVTLDRSGEWRTPGRHRVLDETVQRVRAS
jgi:predicted NBD/HSP70 family sugar kinase